MHTYFAYSKKEMSELAKDYNTVGRIVWYNSIKYKLVCILETKTKWLDQNNFEVVIYN
jgi:hypothetical protein